MWYICIVCALVWLSSVFIDWQPGCYLSRQSSVACFSMFPSIILLLVLIMVLFIFSSFFPTTSSLRFLKGKDFFLQCVVQDRSGQTQPMLSLSLCFRGLVRARFFMSFPIFFASLHSLLLVSLYSCLNLLPHCHFPPSKSALPSLSPFSLLSLPPPSSLSSIPLSF